MSICMDENTAMVITFVAMFALMAFIVWVCVRNV